MASLAARTREAVRERPFLYDGLRAGVINYTAAARVLDVDGETEVIATALRRYAEELCDDPLPDTDGRVSMQSGLGVVADDPDPLLVVGDTAYRADAGSLTGIVATGAVGPAALERALGVLRAEEIDVEAAGVAGETILFVVSRRAGPNALRAVEAALERD